MNEKPHLLLTLIATPLMVPALEEYFVVHVLPDGDGRGAFLDTWGSRIRALVTTTFVGADAALFAALPNLEVVVNGGGHVDTTDLATVAARGLPMAATPDLTTGDVADTVIGLLLAVVRRVAEGDRLVRAGQWACRPLGLATALGGRRLGIVGLGSIGAAAARRAEAFDMAVHYHGPRPKAGVPYPYHPDLVAMAAHVDFLALTCRSGPDTRGLVGRSAIDAIGPAGFLVSVARRCVDEVALVAALTEGRLRGAGLDVFETEPDVPAALLAMDQVVLTPHIGSATEAAKADQVALVLANLRAHFAGRSLVTPVAL